MFVFIFRPRLRFHLAIENNLMYLLINNEACSRFCGKIRYDGVNQFFILESGGGVGTNDRGATESLGLNTLAKIRVKNYFLAAAGSKGAPTNGLTDKCITRIQKTIHVTNHTSQN